MSDPLKFAIACPGHSTAIEAVMYMWSPDVRILML
jgi:hypothetical protein